jgi:hypothetical protein
MTRLIRPALLAAALTTALTAPAASAAPSAGSITWHVGATTSADGCLIRVTVTTVGQGFTGTATAREGEVVAQSQPFDIPPSGGRERRSVTVPGGTYTVQLVTRNGFVRRQTTVDCPQSSST